MENVTVTIGRGIGTTGRTLPEPAWQAFRDRCAEILRTFGADVVAECTGVGQWEGQSEENATVVAIRERTFTDLEREGVRAWFSELAAGYRQDAIALAFGTSELITPPAVSHAFEAITDRFDR
jgi:hypothetical protein